MSTLRPTPVSTRSITFDRDANLLVAEMSSLRNPSFDRVFDDACDVGLTVVSHWTDREVVYALENEVRDGEGDLMYWDLIPANRAEQFLPTLRIFND